VNESWQSLDAFLQLLKRWRSLQTATQKDEGVFLVRSVKNGLAHCAPGFFSLSSRIFYALGIAVALNIVSSFD
jgi:hypothetical protein